MTTGRRFLALSVAISAVLFVKVGTLCAQSSVPQFDTLRASLVDGCIKLAGGDRCEMGGKPSTKSCQAPRRAAPGTSHPDVACVWSPEEVASGLAASTAWYTPQTAPIRVCSRTPRSCTTDSDCPAWVRGETCSWTPGFVQRAQPGSPRLDWLKAHFSELDQTGPLQGDPSLRRYFMEFRWDVVCPLPCEDPAGKRDPTCRQTLQGDASFEHGFNPVTDLLLAPAAVHKALYDPDGPYPGGIGYWRSCDRDWVFQMEDRVAESVLDATCEPKSGRGCSECHPHPHPSAGRHGHELEGDEPYGCLVRYGKASKGDDGVWATRDDHFSASSVGADLKSENWADFVAEWMEHILGDLGIASDEPFLILSNNKPGWWRYTEAVDPRDPCADADDHVYRSVTKILDPEKHPDAFQCSATRQACDADHGAKGGSRPCPGKGQQCRNRCGGGPSLPWGDRIAGSAGALYGPGEYDTGLTRVYLKICERLDDGTDGAEFDLVQLGNRGAPYSETRLSWLGSEARGYRNSSGRKCFLGEQGRPIYPDRQPATRSR